LGWALLGASVLLYSLVLVVPFLPLPGAGKLWTAGALAVAGEGAFWIAAVVLGREVVRRYHSFLNPRNWFGGDRR
jgi:membrane protein DedA with SNARE-associated domain